MRVNTNSDYRPGPGRFRLAATLLAATLLAACGEGLEPELLTGQTMGTAWSVRYGRGSAQIEKAALRGLIEVELESINSAMSTYDPESELSRFNRMQTTDWVPVSPPLAQVVDRALAIGELSNGALDVTAAPLVDAWGFGPDGRRQDPPTPEIVAAARRRVDYRKLQARVDPPMLRKLDPALHVDLSSIAKGFGVDRISQVLNEAGISDYLVEIGGEVSTRGRRPDGNAWRIGIERPDAGGRQVQRVLPMRINGAVATSGDYRNFFEIDGQRYAHIIDPRTGAPVAGTLASVTVIADTCTDADALATALTVLGAEDGYELAATHGLAVMFISRDENGYAERITPELARWLDR